MVEYRLLDRRSIRAETSGIVYFNEDNQELVGFYYSNKKSNVDIEFICQKHQRSFVTCTYRLHNYILFI